MTMTLGSAPGTVDRAISAAGTTQATATVLPADHNLVTTATQDTADGVILRPGNANEMVTVANGTSGSIEVFPPVGARFNNQTANLPMVLPPGRGMIAIFQNANFIFVIAG